MSPWVFYPALLGSWVLYDLVAYSLAGVLPHPSWSIRNVYDTFGGAIIGVLVLAFYYYFDQEIAEATDASRAISGLTDARFAQVRHELVVIPLWPHLLVGILVSIGTIQGAMFQQGFNSVTLSIVPYLIDWILTAVITFGFAFRILRLIFLIGRFYAGPIGIDLFNLPPLHELSTAVGKAGLFLLALWYVNVPLSLNEFILRSPAAIGSAALVALIPLAAFLVPQAILSRRLAREKTRLSVDVSGQLRASFQELKSNLEAKTLDNVERLKAAIEALIAEKKFVEGIPTWPWQLGTFRVALTAVLLPILVWIIQQLLARLIDF